MASKRLLMIVGDYVEDYEVFFTFNALVMAGHKVDVVSPGKKAGDKVKTAIHDSEGDQSFTEKPGHNFELNATFAGLRPEDYDALVIPGGRSPEYLRLNADVLTAVKHFGEAGKPIAAICHGAQILATAGLLTGRRCTSYPSVGPELRLAGADYLEMPWDKAVVDGNLVTAPGWGALGEWVGKFLTVLGTKINT